MKPPICVQCGKVMYCEKNQVLAVRKYECLVVEAHDSDKYKCDVCGMEILTGFGKNPLWSYLNTQCELRPFLEEYGGDIVYYS